MSKERCIHTNTSLERGSKLQDYRGDGAPACISDFLKGSSQPLYVTDKELIPIQSFINKIPTPVFYKNLEGKYSGCNKAFMKFIGASDSNPVAQISEFNTHCEIVEQNCTEEQKLLEESGSRVCESIIKKKNGDISYALINKATITDAHGQACGLIGMISDITTNRLLKDALNSKAAKEGVRRDEHFQELSNIKQALFDENKRRRMLERQLAQASRKLETYIEKHAENSAAMRAVSEYQQSYKKDMEEHFVSHVKHLIMPYVLKLKRNRTEPDELECLNMIESKLNELISPLTTNLSSKHIYLTPKEIQVADLVKGGKQDKEIMGIMNISIDTVKTHRKNIRRKLGIYGDRTNLRSMLLSLS